MRRILVENARLKQAEKRGGGQVRVGLDGIDLVAEPDGVSADELLALDEALARFAREDPPKAELVKLRYLGFHNHRSRNVRQTLRVPLEASEQVRLVPVITMSPDSSDRLVFQ
jgi:hypothetical protein